MAAGAAEAGHGGEGRGGAGREKYGVALHPFNGRNAGVDAYQEVLDLCAYAWQKCDETRAGLLAYSNGAQASPAAPTLDERT